MVGYPHEKWDDKGQINPEEFNDVFDAFPWMEQVDQYDQVKEGCSATISVCSNAHNKDLWVSIAGDNRKSIFLIGYVYQKARRRLFGFGKEEVVKWIDIYELADTNKIKELFQVFFALQFGILEAELHSLKKFDSMKVYTQ